MIFSSGTETDARVGLRKLQDSAPSFQAYSRYIRFVRLVFDHHPMPLLLSEGDKDFIVQDQQGKEGSGEIDQGDRKSDPEEVS